MDLRDRARRDIAGSRTPYFDIYCRLVPVYLFNLLIDSILVLQRAAEPPTLAKQFGA